MNLFGSLRELVGAVFRKNSQAITVRPNQATTYTASRDVQFPPGDTDHTLVSASSTQTLTAKTIDGDDNTLQDIGISSLKTVIGDANEIIRRDSSGAVVSGPVAVSDAGAASGLTQLDVDNIRVDGNTISSTSTNGDITLDPNGTGSVNLDGPTRLRSGTDLVFQDDDNSNSITVSIPAAVGTNRTPQIPDATGDFVLTTATQTLSGKTLTSPQIDTGLVNDYLEVNEEVAPSNPAAGKIRVYAKSGGHLYTRDSAGVEIDTGASSAEATTTTLGTVKRGPYFSAHTATNVVSASAPFIYATELSDSHSGYDTSTGRYTVPETGVYQINWSGYVGGVLDCVLYIDGVSNYQGSNGTSAGPSQGSLILPLTSGQIIDVRAPGSGSGSTASAGKLNTFSACRVG